MTKKEQQQAFDAIKVALLALVGIINVAIDSWDPKAAPLGAWLKKTIQAHQKTIVVAAVGGGGAAGVLGAIALWKASLGTIGTIGAWLGVVSIPAFAPVAGLLLGAAAAAAAAAGITKKLNSAAADTAAELLAQATTVMIFQCLKDEPQKRALGSLQATLVGLGASAELVTRLTKDAPVQILDAMTVKVDDYVTDDRRLALQQAWNSVTMQKKATKAMVAVHDDLCRRMGLEAEGAALRNAVADHGVRLDAMVLATRALAEDPAAPAVLDFLGPLLDMDPEQNAKERRAALAKGALDIAAAAGALAALALGRPQLLAAIAQAYGASRAVLEVDGPAPKEKVAALLGKASELGRKLNLTDADLKGALEPIDKVVDATAKEARKAKKKAA